MTALSTLWNKKQKSCCIYFLNSERDIDSQDLLVGNFLTNPYGIPKSKVTLILPTQTKHYVWWEIHQNCICFVWSLIPQNGWHLMPTANSLGKNKKQVSPFSDPIYIYIWVMFGAYGGIFKETNQPHNPAIHIYPLHVGSTSLGGSLETDATTERWAWHRFASRKPTAHQKTYRIRLADSPTWMYDFWTEHLRKCSLTKGQE